MLELPQRSGTAFFCGDGAKGKFGRFHEVTVVRDKMADLGQDHDQVVTSGFRAVEDGEPSFLLDAQIEIAGQAPS